MLQSYELRGCLLLLFVLEFHWSVSQCTFPDFIIPPGLCVNQQVALHPNLTYQKYDWDFCSGDFDQIPTASVFQTNAGSAFNVEVVEQDGLYFGFYTSRGNRKLYRLDFGTSVMSTPQPIDLGGLNVNSAGWLTIKIVKENGTYYGFIIDFFNKLYRISFGSSITSQPSNAELIYQDGQFSNPIDLELVEDNSNKYAFVANYGSNTVTRFLLGQSFDASPNTFLIDNIMVTGSGGLSGFSIVRECTGWYSIAPSLGGQISRIIFENGLNAAPNISQLSGLSINPLSLGGVDIVMENGKYYAFMQSRGAQSFLYKIDFGNSISNVPQSEANLGDFGLLSDIWGFSMFKAKSRWLVLSSENTANRIFRVTFPSECFSDQMNSETGDNTLLTSSVGTYNISLTVKTDAGYVAAVAKPITISTSVAPDIDFTSQNICVNNNVNFGSANQSGNITDYVWNLGDGNSSTEPNPSHIYIASGNYTVLVNVQGSNGCQNFKEKNLEIFDAPIPQFDLPAGLVCTNNEFTFINKTTDNFDGNLSYAWSVNDVMQGNSRNLQYTFDAAGDYEIKLATSIPGCSNELPQSLLNVQTGPVVGFDFSGNCSGDEISFMNLSSGSIVNYQWDFGNGELSLETNPTIVYDIPGNYLATLQSNGTNGCTSVTSQLVNISSTPKPDFFIDLPPFSCAGTPAQLHDNTAAMIDSNLTTWLWRFNDGTGITADTQNPLHTFAQAGDYNVDLEVETNYGCKSSITQPITISPSPTADFLVGPSCLDKPTLFTNASSSPIQSTIWTINGSIFSTSNPTYTFVTTGNFNASLTVKGSNQCENTKTKQIVIKSKPTLGFTTTAICATKETTFTDQSVGDDLPMNWSWNFGSGNIASGSPVIYSFPSVGVFPVDMSVITEAGCNYSFSKNVTALVPPVASFTATASFGPPPLQIQFNSTSSNASSLRWNFNDDAASTSSQPNPVFTFNQLGDYDVSLTAYNSVGCSDTFSQIINVLIPDVDLSLDNLKIQTNNVTHSISPVVTITNKSNVPISNISVLISGSTGTRVATIIQANLEAGSTGDFIAPLEWHSNDDYLCAELSVFEDRDPLNNARCIDLSSRYVIVQPYPNPSNGNVIFEVVLAEAGSGSIKILDSTGRLIFKNEFPDMIAGMNQLSLDLTGTEPGLYLAVWDVNGQKFEVKFLIR